MENPFQLQFFAKLKQLVPVNTILVDEISEVLKVSMDSAYRRMRGQTALGIDEAIQLCTHYKLPITLFVDEIPGLVNFRFIPPDSKKENFKNYLQMIDHAVDQLLDSEDRRIVYAAIDAPLFHHFGFKKLTIFKMHFWMNVILGVEGFKDHYDEDDVDRSYLEISQRIYQNYLVVPSVEIWPENILATTLKQIEYYWDSGYFQSTKEPLEILEQLNNLVDHVENMAERKCKLQVGDKTRQEYSEFNLYQSDVLLGNNTVLTTANHIKTAYISHLTFLTLATVSENYTNYTEQWLNNITNKSNLISGIAEKSRTKFFRALRKSVEETLAFIKE